MQLYIIAAPENNTDSLQVYLNIVLDDATEEKAGGARDHIGMVVIRGNAVVMLEVRIVTTAQSGPKANQTTRHLTASTPTSTSVQGTERRYREIDARLEES